MACRRVMDWRDTWPAKIAFWCAAALLWANILWPHLPGMPHLPRVVGVVVTGGIVYTMVYAIPSFKKGLWIVMGMRVWGCLAIVLGLVVWGALAYYTNWR